MTLVIEFISDKVCDKIIQFSIRKRRDRGLTARLLFAADDDSPIYVNKMLPKYYENLAYEARAKKRLKNWKSVSVNNGNILVRPSDGQQPIKCATRTRLSNL